MLSLLNLSVLSLLAALTWWLTGLDKSVTGESKRDRYFTRTLRTAAVTLLFGAMLWLAESDCGYGGAPLLLILPISIALILRSSLAELGTHGLLRMLDPSLHDRRPLDRGKAERYLNLITHLVKKGHRAEALKWCGEFKRSGEVDPVALENLMEFHGLSLGRPPVSRPLAEAAQLRAGGKFSAAEVRLQALLAKNPADSAAAMMLMRLCAEDLRQPGRARDILRTLERQPHVDRSLIEFARRSIEDWSRPKTPVKAPAPLPDESLEALLAGGFYGTAIQQLEAEIAAQPHDFALRLKLAEIHAVYCKNVPRAEKLIRQLALEPAFTPAQAAAARLKLQHWQAGGA